MKIGQAGISLIKSYEKCKLRAYLPTPNDKWTIGFGHTGADVTSETVWTQEEADAAFLKDIAWVETCLNDSVRVPILQTEFDAMASLIFNIGCPQFRSSTLLRLLNSGDFDAAALEFRRWDRQAGQVLAGLTRRRAEEARLFDTPEMA